MNTKRLNRRGFLQQGLTWAAATPLGITCASHSLLAAVEQSAAPSKTATRRRTDARVAISACPSYGPEVRKALDRCFDLLGGIGALVRNKTVTIKINLTGTNFAEFLGRPVGETYMTHYATAFALASALFTAGARRVRFVESTQSRAELQTTLSLGDWDVKALEALGRIEFENTRNLGKGATYAHLPVPGNGYMFSSFDFNHAYADTDVMVSLAKLKNHATTGVTLSMKNMFGLTPNTLYGSEAGSEEAVAGRDPLHSPRGHEHIKLPGLKTGITSLDSTWRVPHIIADVCAARPIHLAIIDGITAMNGAEGPWCQSVAMKVTTPGLLIAGLNPVSTDAVGVGVMGYADPRAARGTKPFGECDNHLLLAEQAGLGCAELAGIDVRGLTIERARYSYG
jgi:uncharacterized protein (DUF362 family)